MHRTVGLVAGLLLLWFPVSYVYFVLSYVPLQTFLSQRTAAVTAVAVAALLGGLTMVVIGRPLHRQIHR